MSSWVIIFGIKTNEINEFYFGAVQVIPPSYDLIKREHVLISWSAVQLTVAGGCVRC